MKPICVSTVFTPIFVSALLTFAPAPAAAGSLSPLISPWDTRPVYLTQAPFECGPPLPIAPDLTVTKGLSNSNLSPAAQQAIYPESDEALLDLTARTVQASDAFIHTGSQDAARCTITLLADAAADHAMAGYMATADATHEQSMALRSVAIAYLKVRNSRVVTADEQALIIAWLEDVAHQERGLIASGPCAQNVCDTHGHHGIGIVMATTAVAVAADDRHLFSWSVGQYRAAIHYIDERGMSRYDTHGQWALKFNLLSAGGLVQIAEFGEINGEPMYAYDQGRIHLLVLTVSRSLIDPGPFAAATGVKQRMSSTIEPWEITWASVYNRRFPDPVISGLLQQIGPASADMWGGEPASGVISQAAR